MYTVIRRLLVRSCPLLPLALVVSDASKKVLQRPLEVRHTPLGSHP
jgi:hypothetical protein